MNIYYDLERSCSKRETSYFILLEILVLKEILLNWIYYVPLGKKATVTCFHKSGGSCYSVGGVMVGRSGSGWYKVGTGSETSQIPLQTFSALPTF